MVEPTNTDRFTDLADIYAAHRPAYPVEVMAELRERLMAGGSRPKVALDVGCGTGISTRALGEVLPDWQIIGIEPNDDMRQRAEVSRLEPGHVSFVAAEGENLPANDGAAGLVLAAQALHWFDAEKFANEAARVLPSGGVLAILYNNRQNQASAALRAIEDYLEEADPTYSRAYRERDVGAWLNSLDEFGDVTSARRVWLQRTSTDDLVNYFMSRSMLQPIAEKVGLSKLRHKIGDIANEHAEAAMLDIPFATELDMATRL